MPSLHTEPKGFFYGFTVWDFFVIFVVSDLASGAIMQLLSGNLAAIFLLILPVALWWLHIYNVEREIKEGIR